MGPLVLVVEDDHDTRELLREILELEGYRVKVAQNGEEALRLLRALERPQLVLLDMVMPVVGGMQVLTIMRGDPELSPIPVVALSASVSKKPLSPGATHFFRKPFRLSELLDTVQKLVPLPIEVGAESHA